MVKVLAASDRSSPCCCCSGCLQVMDLWVLELSLRGGGGGGLAQGLGI